MALDTETDHVVISRNLIFEIHIRTPFSMQAHFYNLHAIFSKLHGLRFEIETARIEHAVVLRNQGKAERILIALKQAKHIHRIAIRFIVFQFGFIEYTTLGVKRQSEQFALHYEFFRVGINSKSSICKSAILRTQMLLKGSRIHHGF